MPNNSKSNGLKIETSQYRSHVVKLIYDGIPQAGIRKILKDRYGFSCSVPCLSYFIRNYYPKHLCEMQRSSNVLQKEQVGRAKTFIDESLGQAIDIKESIGVLTRHLATVEEEIAFVHKFEKMFCNAFDKYVECYDEKEPKKFLDSASSKEEKALKSMIDNMGVQGGESITTFIQTHNTTSLLKLLAVLQSRLLVHREALVRIHKELFRGYRNYSILQELTVIFERYNSIVVEEFFPDKNNMDMEKFDKIRKRILALFDEFQIRYQGVESPKEVSSVVDADNDITRASKKMLKDAETEYIPITKEIKELENDDRLKRVFEDLKEPEQTNQENLPPTP